MLPKKGKVFPKKGNVLPGAEMAARLRVRYAEVVATALGREFGRSQHATKTVMRWTGASERTVKNWFSGANGPSGEHLSVLMEHSDCVFRALLHRTKRERDGGSTKVAALGEALARAVDLFQELSQSV